MEPPPSHIFHCTLLLPMILFVSSISTGTTTTTSCRDTCGSLQIKYPFGTGPGCGSPLFTPYTTCTSIFNGTNNDHLFLLKTHTGSYPITSISYTTSTLTVTPPYMSTCTNMHTSHTNFGLDWTAPFQIGSSTFILLSCQPPTSSLTIKDSTTPICDPSFDYLCASIYTCPAVVELNNMPLFPPTNTCCVYAPANLDGKGELDLKELKCGGYASVVSLGDDPTDPTHWVYGVALKYSSYGALDGNYVTSKCNTCEYSGGICGYAPPGNGFVCVCKGGYNTSLDCSNNNYNQQNQDYLWDSMASPLPTVGYVWSSILTGITLSFL